MHTSQMNSIPDSVSDLLIKLRDSNHTEINSAKEELHRLVGPNVIVRWEKKEEAEKLRVLLTTNRLESDFKRKLERECNGVVLTYPDWNIVSMPSPMLSNRFCLRELQLSDFEIFEIKDGTTITLYYYDDNWRISSKNGFDMGSYCWMGPKTYMEVFEELIQLYPDFSLDKLDKNASYTIGFHYHDFHPIASDPDKMWLIQAYNGEVTSPDIGIPLQKVADLPKENALTFIQAKNNNSVSKYVETNSDIHYGYILRSDAANYIIESTLLRDIRIMMYNLPKHRFEKATAITAENRREYMILKAYLSYNTRYLFENLFPQFSPMMKKYDEMFKQLISKIMIIMRGQGKSSKTDLDKLATILVEHINSKSRINVMDTHARGIIENFVIDVEYVELYYTLLVDNK